MSGRSSCPDCGTILRIRDRSFVGRRVSCPECKVALRIVSEESDGNFMARRVTQEEQISRGRAGADIVLKDEAGPARVATRSFFRRLFDSPLTAAWLLAIAISSLIAVLALAPKKRFAAVKPPAATSQPSEIVAAPSATSSITPDPESTNDSETEAKPPALSSTDKHEAESMVSPLEPIRTDDPPLKEPNELDGKPDLAPLVPAKPKVDLETKLMQKLVSYKQIKPVSRRDLIEALQEHLGAPIRYEQEDLGMTKLDQMITFELENTTVGGVMRKLTEAAGWEIQLEDDGIRLTRQAF